MAAWPCLKPWKAEAGKIGLLLTIADKPCAAGYAAADRAIHRGL